jgi:hypothetical protein
MRLVTSRLICSDLKNKNPNKMKNLNKVIASAIVLIGFSANSFGQAATASDVTATATIVAPISISKTVDFSFGNVGKSALGGDVVLAVDGTRSSTGVTIAAGGTVTAASFNVGGEASHTYAITFPSSAVALKKSGATDMTVDTWTTSLGTDAAALVGTLDVNGAQTFTAGATLHVGSAQESGVYTSDAFNVSVDYN